MEWTVEAHSTNAGSELSAYRMARLQSVIASLAGALTPEDVAAIILTEAIGALGADAGSVVVTTADESRLERVGAVGYPDTVLDSFGRYAMDDPLPAVEALRTGRAIWIASLDVWRECYPAVAPLQAQLGFEAAACIPLVIHERKLGLLALSFRHRLDDDAEGRAFAITLAQQCAQALDRARLYAAERLARTQAETERARLHDLFMRAPARIALTCGPDHIYMFANAQYVAELDDPHIIGRPARDVFPGAEDQGIIALADHVFATGEPYLAREAPFRVDRDRDGTAEERFFDVVMQPSYSSDGSIEGVMLFSVDVTEGVRSRRRVEVLLAERNAILGQIADGLLITDAGQQIVFANEGAAQIVGVNPAGMTTRSLAETLDVSRGDGQNLAADAFAVDEALRSGRITPFEYHLIRPDDTEVIIQGSVAPVADENGTQVGGVVTFRDVTAQRTLERQKDDFLAAAAHDLKTPLTTIKGVTQILQRRIRGWGAPEAGGLMNDLDRIDGTVTKMNMLINKLLDLTRLQMDQPLTLDKRKTDLVELAAGVIEDQRTVSKRHTLRLVCDVPAIIGTVDAFRIERVLTNLISNSIRYSPGGDEITVCLREVSDDGTRQAMITVADHGLGIPAGDLPHVFERFYRAGNVEGKIAGAGIGLAGVSQIVEQHGGSISAASDELAGTTFTVLLPLDG